MPRAAKKVPARLPLSQERILTEALRQADEIGVKALSMRKLAQALGVEAMSLYNHIANKEQMLNGMVELVMNEIYSPKPQGNWKKELQKRGISVHGVLLKHPWAAPLMESRGSGNVQLSKHNAVLGCLRGAGFSIEAAHQALLTLDSYLYGFAFQESTWPFARDEVPSVIQQLLPQLPVEKYPHLLELMEHLAGPTATVGHKEKSQQKESAYRKEFEFGLNLILDGFERLLCH